MNGRMNGKDVCSKEVVEAVKQGLEEGLGMSLEEYMANNTPNGSDKVEFCNANDIVNHPAHYTAYGKESIELMDLYFGETTVMAFCLCSCWKYYYRHGLKSGNELTDIRKLSWYADRYLSYVTALQEEAESHRNSVEQEIKDFEYAHDRDDTNRYILFRIHDALKDRNMVYTSILAHIYLDRFKESNTLYATTGSSTVEYVPCSDLEAKRAEGDWLPGYRREKQIYDLAGNVIGVEKE